MIKFVVVYIVLGTLSFYFSNITSDLAVLGVSESIVSIASKFLDAAVKGTGMVGAAVFGLSQLPSLPGRPSTSTPAVPTPPVTE